MGINEKSGMEYIPEIVDKIRGQVYADIMLDWTFKYVFGPQGKYKEGLISLLNSIIPEKKIRDIEYLPTEILGEVAEQRKSVMDLRCVSDDGSQFVVEVQNYREKGFFERCVLYACKLFQEQNKRGVKYKELMPVYVVAILSEEASREMNIYKDCRGQVIYDHTMIEKISGIFAPRTISVIFADTGKFTKDIAECVDDADRWLFLLRHSTRIREYSEAFQSEVFRRVLEALEISSFTQEEYNMYYTAEEQKKIRQAQDDTIREESFAEGRAEGLAEGEAKGREEGDAKGREEGRYDPRTEANRETARKMLARGMGIEDIADMTGLTPDEIKEL